MQMNKKYFINAILFWKNPKFIIDKPSALKVFFCGFFIGILIDSHKVVKIKAKLKGLTLGINQTFREIVNFAKINLIAVDK